MNQFTSIILAARPKTLPAIIVPVWAGCMIINRFAEHFPDSGIGISWTLALATLISAICIQIACNLFNDSIDSDKKADTAKRQGPRRITASGAMSSLAVKGLACFFLLLASGFALPLIIERGWPILAIGIPSMFLAYGYTGGPWPLAYKGLGEAFVLLFFGLIAVMGTVFVQAGWQAGYENLYVAAAIVGIQCGLLSCVLIEINNIRDRKEDASTGKRTLAVRMGESRARGLAIACIVAPYLTLKQSVVLLPGLKLGFIWLAPLLLGGYLIFKISRTPADKRMNPLLGLAALHMILYLVAMTWS